MKKIGLLSDTHGLIDEKILDFFKDCDEIWHAGDIGNIETANKIEQYLPLKAVFGNIDGHEVRISYPRFQNFKIEDVKVLMTHIGGYPGKYEKEINELFKTETPDLFICGHSHILKVIYDKKYNLLHINPGAAGKSGLHKKQTAVRFVINGNDIKDMEIWEKDRY